MSRSIFIQVKVDGKTLQSVADHYAKKTGRSYTAQAIKNRINFFMLKHPDEVKEILGTAKAKKAATKKAVHGTVEAPAKVAA